MPEKSRKLRVLYLQTTPVPPPTDASIDRFVLLSDRLEGDILAPTWLETPADIQKALGDDAWPSLVRGSFRYRWCTGWQYQTLKSRVSVFWFYIAEGLRAHREQPFDCVMAYSHMTTALLGLIICWSTGAKLVVEVVSSPDRVFIKEYPHPPFSAMLRKFYSDICLHITLLSCSQVHLLYKEQLDAYPLLRQVPRTIFHEYVPVGHVPKLKPAEPPVILLLGAPWYLKGADLLVAAFLRLTPDFPDVTLQIMGHFPDGDQLRVLTQGCPRIEILKACPNPEALQRIATSSILVLASRCEGMGRVVLEAMAAGVPVVGSRVGGIPSLVWDGENGLLFPEEDDAALEACLRKLLADPELGTRLGNRGYEMSHSDFNEQTYTDAFVDMIRKASED